MKDLPCPRERNEEWSGVRFLNPQRRLARWTGTLLVGVTIVSGRAILAWGAPTTELANQGYRLTVSQDDAAIRMRLEDRTLGMVVADGPCLYHAAAGEGQAAIVANRLENSSVTTEGQTLVIRGKLLGLDLEQRFTAPADRPILEERIVLKNNTGKQVALSDLEIGMQRQVADKERHVSAELAADRFAAVPFRYRAPNPRGSYYDYSLADLVLDTWPDNAHR